MNAHDHQHAIDTINWFAERGFDKMSHGSAEHGGVLRHKGGLLAEAEAECLDFAFYIRALRYQLSAIHLAVADGKTQEAASALRLLLYGDTTDTLPGAVVGP